MGSVKEKGLNHDSIISIGEIQTARNFSTAGDKGTHSLSQPFTAKFAARLKPCPDTKLKSECKSPTIPAAAFRSLVVDKFVYSR